MSRICIIIIQCLLFHGWVSAQTSGGIVKRPSNTNISKNNQVSTQNKTNKSLFKYDAASDFQEGIACVKKNNKWGAIDKNARSVIPCKYDYLGSFSEGLAPVEINGKRGFIDKTGREVVPCKYADATNFSEGLAAVKQNNKWGFIDNTGNFLRINGKK